MNAPHDLAGLDADRLMTIVRVLVDHIEDQGTAAALLRAALKEAEKGAGPPTYVVVANEGYARRVINGVLCDLETAADRAQRAGAVEVAKGYRHRAGELRVVLTHLKQGEGQR